MHEQFDWPIDYTPSHTPSPSFLYIITQTDCMSIPIVNAWQLNERHYGALQGLDKQMTVDKYGKDKVHLAIIS